MWVPFTYAPAHSKVIWFMLVVTPLASMCALAFANLRSELARTTLLGLVTFVQLGLMLAVAMHG